MAEPRFLIIGASGFIGSRLYATLGPGRSIATFMTRPVAGAQYFDPLATRLADGVLRGTRGLTHAFVLYGMTNIDDCARRPALAYEVNVASQKRVVDDLLDRGVVPIVASSDSVFNGVRGLSMEDDALDPVLTYGRHKAEMERYLAEKKSDWLIARLAKVVDATPGSGDLIESWMTQLEKSDPIRCARDQVFSPVDARDVVKALIVLAEQNVHGVYNVCGPRPLTRLAFLRMLAEEVGKYHAVRARIVPCSIRDFDFAEPRPLDASMSANKLYATIGYGFEDMAVVCARAAKLRYAGALTR